MQFRLLNIPVRIQPTFWLFLILFTNIYRDPSWVSIMVGVIFFVSLLVHEFGHALTAQQYGCRPTVTLEAFGGRAEYTGAKLSRKQQFFITLNGPLLESVLIFIPYFLLKGGMFADHPYVQHFLYMTMRINIIWCLLNLIPIMPLDGGKLVYYLLEAKFGERGYKYTLMLGMASALVIAPLLCLKGLFFFAVLLVIFGYQNYKSYKQNQSKTHKTNPFSSYMQGVEALKNNELDKAKSLLKTLLKSQDSNLKHSSIESLAKVYCQENKTQKAYELLMNADHQRLKEGKCLLCQLAFERGNYSLVSRYSRDIYATNPTYETAILNSKAFAHLKEADLAGGWLKTASAFDDESFAKASDLLGDEVYDSVKNHEDFKNFVEHLETPELTKI